MGLNISPDEEESMVSAINTTPLVDVMLVLLIIFLITIPVVTTAIKVKLPPERVEVRETKPENIIISVDQSGRMYWFETPVASVRELTDKLKKVSQQRPQPEVQIRGDMSARYEGTGKALLACQYAGISKVAFITEPPPLGN